jgi:hypothetical protein
MRCEKNLGISCYYTIRARVVSNRAIGVTFYNALFHYSSVLYTPRQVVRQFIDITPAPILSGLDGSYNRVFG